MSDGVIEFESPVYHVFQDSGYIDVTIVRNLFRDTSYLKNVSVMVVSSESADGAAYSKSIGHDGGLVSFREVNAFFTFYVPTKFNFTTPERDANGDFQLNSAGKNPMPWNESWYDVRQREKYGLGPKGVRESDRLYNM